MIEEIHTYTRIAIWWWNIWFIDRIYFVIPRLAFSRRAPHVIKEMQVHMEGIKFQFNPEVYHRVQLLTISSVWNCKLCPQNFSKHYIGILILCEERWVLDLTELFGSGVERYSGQCYNGGGRISFLLSIHVVSFAGIAHLRGGESAAPHKTDRRRQVWQDKRHCEYNLLYLEQYPSNR